MRKHKQAARLAGQESKAAPAASSGLCSALRHHRRGTRGSRREAIAAGAGSGARAKRPGGMPSTATASGPGRSSSRPREGQGKGCVRGPPHGRRAASHQQRQAEEAPSRQQVRRRRRHLRFRQQERGRPAEAVLKAGRDRVTAATAPPQLLAPPALPAPRALPPPSLVTGDRHFCEGQKWREPAVPRSRPVAERSRRGAGRGNRGDEELSSPLAPEKGLPVLPSPGREAETGQRSVCGDSGLRDSGRGERGFEER